MAILHKKGTLSGAVGNIVMRTFNSQTVVQAKPKKFKQTPASKASALEFGLASATSLGVRHAIVPACAVSDKKMVNRFNTTILKAIRSSSKERGERDLHDGDLSHLKGFQFNANSPLTDVLSVRPESSMPAPDKIRVSIPSFSLRSVKGWRVDDFCRVRLLVTAFHFKEKWAEFIGHEDIEITSIKEPFEAREWLFEHLPVGCVIIVTVSIHAFTTNLLRERVELNSRDWSPAEIIGAYHTLDENGETLVSSMTERNIQDRAHLLHYTGNDILKAFQELWEIHGKPEKPKPQPPGKSLELKIPIGRFELKQQPK